MLTAEEKTWEKLASICHILDIATGSFLSPKVVSILNAKEDVKIAIFCFSCHH